MALGPVETTFDEISWKLLQTSIRLEKDHINDRDSLREYIDEPGGVVNNCQRAQNISMEIEQKNVSCEKLREKIAKINQKILIGKGKLSEVNEELSKKQNFEESLKQKIEIMELQINKNQSKKDKEVKSINVLIRLVAYRKLTLIKEVMDLFKVKIDGGPASEAITTKNCQCQLIDTIRGLHIPQITHIFNHSEAPTLTALQNLTHLFNVICKVLHFAPKYPILTNLQIINPIDQKSSIFTEKCWKKKADREKLIEGMSWLSKNISHLRESCGIPTMATDRILGTLEEWIRLVIRKETVFERPINSIFSPANLLIDYQIPNISYHS